MPSETFTNRLSQEKSPYLLQHAHNPVDWYPWGEEAFVKARAEDKPIFLSIGYSTCHWCHVMEEESFVDPAIAKILNQHFVSIKVDREERPDVDHIYMQAVMAMTGAGGWPMSVFLTPELKPFYGGTYFPPEDRWGRPGFVTLLNAIAEKWAKDRERVFKSSEELTQAIQAETRAQAAGRKELDAQKILQTAYEQLESRFDSERGGFGEAPKFPQGHTLSFLLRYWKRTGNDQALQMVTKTLDEMARGGMYDQIGGGFHRYSTDREWRVPHFEKMLYDQAMLSKAYLEAYQATGNPEYARVAREIFDYILRDMTPPPAIGPKGQSVFGRYTGGGVTGREGGFYSAEDADSAPDASEPEKKKEGSFYVWTEDQIQSILGKEKAEIFNYCFGIRKDGNALEDPQGELAGENILYVGHTLAETAKEFAKSEKEIEQILSQSKAKLFATRAKRPRPHLDDKVLTDWNGLMISSLAFGSRVLNEARYRDAAKKAADFILKNMVIASPEIMEHSSPLMGEDKGGGDLTAIPPILTFPHKGGRKHSVASRKDMRRLMHRYRDGQVSIKGFLDDYAFFIHGLIDLYEATFDPRYLEEAKFLAKEMLRLFWDGPTTRRSASGGYTPEQTIGPSGPTSGGRDESSGGFFFTGADAEKLISPTKELYDGAIPSGNSLATLSLLRLARLTMEREFESDVERIFSAFSAQLTQYPSGFSQMMAALDFALGPSQEIVIAGNEGDLAAGEMVREIFAHFLPNKVVLLHPRQEEARRKIEALSPFVKSQVSLNGRPTVYVCKNYVCDLPVTEVEKLGDLLNK